MSGVRFGSALRPLTALLSAVCVLGAVAGELGSLHPIGSAGAADQPPLRRLDTLDRRSVTVSGLSSGAYFAHQFHIAYSGLIGGAGIIAGGPYGCATQTAQPYWLAFNPYANSIVALGMCTRFARSSFGWLGALPEAPDPDRAVAAIRAARARGTIDDPANLARHRVWLFSGTADSVVPPAIMATLATTYRRLGVAPPRLAVDDTVAAAHGLPIHDFIAASRFRKLGCQDQELPYVMNCGRDAAEMLLRHLYPDGFQEPREPDRAHLVAFDQSEFFDKSDRSTSLHATGWLYVPAACGGGTGQACRLHVAFHGCDQHQDLIEDDFYWDGGYNRWAEANDIVVLYPQATPWTTAWDPFGYAGNPKGCWDWWGYGGAEFLNQRGKQMRAVRAMIGRLLGE
jgi:hypothetical protein